MDNEYQVIFLPDNGKSRSIEDKSIVLSIDKTTKTVYTTKQWRGGQMERVKKSDLRLRFPLSNLYQPDKLVSNLPIHI